VNAGITRDVLSGRPGACRKIVVLNAALAIVAGGKAGTIQDGIAAAEAAIDGGGAMKKLRALINMSNG